MCRRRLSALQVAVLLVSSSYGIGFLFGSGEMAMHHGMGGSLYGLSTALGMLLLSVFAARLWRTALPIWDLFGVAYGAGLKSSVALLSVLWMAGVLAAQIHGGVAITNLLGLSAPVAYGVVVSAIFLASRLELRLASAVFAFFMLASGLVLVYMLLKGPGSAFYLNAPARFIQDLPSFRPTFLLTVVIAIVVLVCTGGDYHQFVLAAKAPRAAVAGCVLAGICLAAVSFLPASVVLGLRASGELGVDVHPKQVIPFALMQGVSSLGEGVGRVLLGGLSLAALGSGAAILRAMTSALESAFGKAGASTPWQMAGFALAIGALLASRGQGIVETMVSINVVYIGSIAVVFAAVLTEHRMSSRQAASVMAAGFSASMGIYIATWLDLAIEAAEADLISLCGGLIASLSVFLAIQFLKRRLA